MITNCQISRAARGEAGLMLVECLIYLSMSVLVVGIALSAFYKALDNSRSLRRNSDDITRVLHAGETWRDDIRSASGSIINETNISGTVVRIPHGAQAVLYFFTGTNILRGSDTNSLWTEALAKVKASRMTNDSVGAISAWRWDVELDSARKYPRIRPLFSFQAVPKLQNQR